MLLNEVSCLMIAFKNTRVIGESRHSSVAMGIIRFRTMNMILFLIIHKKSSLFLRKYGLRREVEIVFSYRTSTSQIYTDNVFSI
jgi:hypothetical protein